MSQSNRRMKATEKQRKVLELYKAGMDWESIAQAVGYSSASGAYRAFQAALKKTLKQPAKEVRELQLMRYDTLLLSVWNKARNGELKAIDRVVKILDKINQLHGIEAPKKITIDGNWRELAQKDGINPDEIIKQFVALATEALDK